MVDPSGWSPRAVPQPEARPSHSRRDPRHLRPIEKNTDFRACGTRFPIALRAARVSRPRGVQASSGHSSVAPKTSPSLRKRPRRTPSLDRSVSRSAQKSAANSYGTRHARSCG